MMNLLRLLRAGIFLLSTIDENNRPTVSYKGGDIGLVKILDKKTAIFLVTMETECFFQWAIF